VNLDGESEPPALDRNEIHQWALSSYEEGGELGSMGNNSPSLGSAEEEIARELVRVHQEAYGQPVEDLRVAIHETFVAVVMEVRLTPAEEALAQAGSGAAVRTTREEFSQAIGPVYKAIVERATGRRVEGFVSRVAVEAERPWGVEIFLLAPRVDRVEALIE